MPKIAKPRNFSYMGIDPGKFGAIAILNGEHLCTFKIPETDQLILELFADASPDKAILEKVGGFVSGNPAPGSAMFNFGLGYGLLRMGLAATAIPFEETPPQKWLKGLGLGTKGKRTPGEWKSYLYQKAQQLYPSVSFPKYAADAVLIATFCKRKHGGTL